MIDGSGGPRKNYRVDVFWSDGHTHGRTNSQGDYDTGRSKGTIKEVCVEGRTVYNMFAVDSRTETLQVKYT